LLRPSASALVGRCHCHLLHFNGLGCMVAGSGWSWPFWF
jgi:hypothetical protein